MTKNRTPSLAGSSGQDSPNLTGWGKRSLSGVQEKEMKAWEILRRDHEPPSDLIEIPSEAERVFRLAMGEWIRNGVHGFWNETDGDGHSNPEAFVADVGGRYATLSSIYNGRPTQSPIEDQMLGALLWQSVQWAGFPKGDLLDGPEDEVHLAPAETLEFWITSQSRLGPYKADFLLWFHMKRIVAGVAVECDGHAFHEKTKEQASRDKERDRYFLKSGFPVMRFSGSDIFKDPLKCADEVGDALLPILERVSKDGGLFGA